MRTSRSNTPWAVALSAVMSMMLACAGSDTPQSSEAAKLEKEPGETKSDPGSPSATMMPGASKPLAPDELDAGVSSTDEQSFGGSPGEGESSESAGGAGGQETPAGGGMGGQGTDVQAISFTQVQQEVFQLTGCSAGYCHGGGAGDMAWSYESLVSTDAAEAVCGLTQRVVPGDPESSILWQRVRPRDPEETEPCATPMPASGAPLSAQQAQLVYDWIASGAAP